MNRDEFSLGRIIHCLGDPPQMLFERMDKERYEEYRLSECFDKNRDIKSMDGITFDSFFDRLEGEEKVAIIEFMKRALTWLPEDRAVARQLLRDPWLREARKKLSSK